VSGSTSFLIFYGDVALSMRAAMLFPADQEKSRVVVGWAIARDLQSPTDRSTDDLVSIARDAAAFANLRKEVGDREYNGGAAGEVMKALFLMIAHDPHRPYASMEWAMRTVEDVVDKTGGHHRSKLHEHLKLFRPVLHLWVVRRLDERWPHTQDEADAFIERAEIVREQLTIWNQIRRQPIPHLQEFIEPYEGWRPQGLRLYPPYLRSIPVKKAGGRPKKKPSSS
jgi:hypothetical protein